MSLTYDDALTLTTQLKHVFKWCTAEKKDVGTYVVTATLAYLTSGKIVIVRCCLSRTDDSEIKKIYSITRQKRGGILFQIKPGNKAHFVFSSCFVDHYTLCLTLHYVR